MSDPRHGRVYVDAFGCPWIFRAEDEGVIVLERQGEMKVVRAGTFARDFEVMDENA